MKKKLFTLFLSLFLIPFTITAQKSKIKIKNGIVTVDEKPFLKWIRISSVEASISGLEADEEEIFATWRNYPDPSRASKDDPKGLLHYIELYFPTLDLRCEINSIGTRKNLVNFLILNKIYVNGTFNEENVVKLVKKYGTKFSDNQPKGNVIIINNK